MVFLHYNHCSNVRTLLSHYFSQTRQCFRARARTSIPRQQQQRQKERPHYYLIPHSSSASSCTIYTCCAHTSSLERITPSPLGLVFPSAHCVSLFLRPSSREFVELSLSLLLSAYTRNAKNRKSQPWQTHIVGDLTCRWRRERASPMFYAFSGAARERERERARERERDDLNVM